MKILYVTEIFPSHENPAHGPFIMRRIHALHDLGHKVVILSLEWSSVSGKSFLRRRCKQIYNLIVGKCFIEEYSPIEKAKRLRIHKLLVPKIRYLNKLSLLIILFRYMRKHEYDIVHAHFLWYAYAAFLIQKYFRLPFVITVHGSDLHGPLGSSVAIKKYHALNYKIMRQAKKVIFVSNYLKNMAIDSYAYGLKHALVILNGIDSETFYPSLKQKRNNLRVAYVGRLCKAKGLCSLPFIFSYVKNVYPEASFLLVGKNELSSENEEYIRKKSEFVKSYKLY